MKKLGVMAATLLLAAMGGWIFSLFKMPLAWMLGAMLVTAAASLAGAPLQGSQRLRDWMIAVLGLMLGAAFTPDIADRAVTWWRTLIPLLGFIVAMTALLSWGLRRYGRFDPVSALFAATPGGFGEMVLLSDAYGGDPRAVSLIHSVRVMITVLVIPFWFRVFQGYEPSPPPPGGITGGLVLNDGVILVACAVAGLVVARRLRLPAAALLGPTIASAIAHMAGWTQATPPDLAVNGAQVVIGVSVGCRFVGIPLRRVSGILGLGVVSAVVTLTAAVAAALAVERMTGLPFDALWLAFSPGGLAEMTLISLAMDIDTAFVSSHHMARIIFIVMTASIAVKIVRRK